MITHGGVKYLLVALAMGIVGFYGGQLFTRGKTTDINKPLDSLITLETNKGKLEVLISSDQVYLQPFEAAEDNQMKAITITREQYPRLFKQGAADSSFITAKIEPGSGDSQQITISNNQPNHGGYSPTYHLTVDPLSGDIQE